MDTIQRYRILVKEVISAYAQFKPSVGQVEVEVVFDDAQDHYELLHNGWSGPHRVHGSVIHVDLRGGKFWIQHDGTERGIALDLVDRGVPHSDIVLAFKPPAMRAITDFAVD